MTDHEFTTKTLQEMSSYRTTPVHFVKAPDERKILRNMARCPLCDTVVESQHVHDYVTCKCGEMFVDGGREYLRRGGRGPIEELSTYC